MVVRHGLLLVLLASSGCAIVSGLANLDVDGGTFGDASPDVGLDVTPLPTDASDSGSVIEASTDAGRALTALKTTGGCTKTSTNVLPLAGEAFTIELWLRVDAPTQQTAGAILWKGGQDTTSPGWSLLLQSSSIMFCVSDAQSQVCTAPYPVVAQHLVHVAISSNVLVTRTLQLYARDITAGDKSHALVGSSSQAPASWTSPTPFTIGGIWNGTSCTNMTSVTVDDVRIFTNTTISAAFMDQSESVDIACSLVNLSADYKFNDGTGTIAADCANKFDLTLGATASFVASPFP